MPRLDGWRAEDRRITIDDLRKFVAALPPEAKETYGRRHFVLCMYVLQQFLGDEWCRTHLAFPKRGYLMIDFDNDKQREKTSLIIFELAQNIYNLQTIPGFDNCLMQMKRARPDSEQIESTYAELEFARILSFYRIKFRFVPREEGKKTPDYELIYPDGTMALADAKCKIDGSQISAANIRGSLKDAIQKFPKSGPGIVFVKVPQEWAEDRASRVLMRDTAVSFLRGVGRIASVKYYAAFLTHDRPGVTTRNYAFMEIPNPDCRTERNRDWDLFNVAVPPEWKGRSPDWVDLAEIANEES